ncbi:MAG: hypothetical protein ABIX01_04115 [Chitinophagaceae bacterium]
MTFMKVSSKIAVAALAVYICLSACKKTSPSDKLVLKFKSISSTDVRQGQLLTLEIECNDVTQISTKADTAIGVEFTILNKNNVCSFSGGTKVRTTPYPVPDLSRANTSNSLILLEWDGNALSSIPGNKCRPIDTTQIRIWVKNKAGVTSDTLVVPNPVIIRNS